MARYGLVIFLLLFLLVHGVSASGEGNDVVLETIRGNNVIDASPSLIIKSPQGVTAFIDAANISSNQWTDQLANPTSLFAQTLTGEFSHDIADVKSYRGTKLIAKVGVISSGDIRIEGIEASRYDDSIDGSDIILIIDVAGYRIVHLGDCGQTSLTQKQLEKIGRADLVVAAVEWNYSELNMGNKKALKLLSQINPTIVIPSHIASLTSTKHLNNTWPGWKISGDRFVLNSESLSKRKTIFWGDNLRLAKEAGIPELNQ